MNKSIQNYPGPKPRDPYSLTPEILVRKKLELLKLQDGEVLYDLGCGDARCLILAQQYAQVKGVGYEILPEAISTAEKNVKDAGLASSISIVNQDFYSISFSEADAIIMYLTRGALGALSLALEEQMKPGARIVTHQFDIPGWTAEEEIQVLSPSGEMEPVFLYRKH